jgi:aryl-alcohol dehydrogenase-like predicted oxidoreductase
VLPLIAASTPEQLQENLDALKVELGASQIERLSNARA